MSTTLLMQMLTMNAREPCYDDWHVYSPWFPNQSLPFDTMFRVCGVCGNPETWVWIEDAD